MNELFKHEGIPQYMCDECRWYSEYGCTAEWCDYRKKTPHKDYDKLLKEQKNE